MASGASGDARTGGGVMFQNLANVSGKTRLIVFVSSLLMLAFGIMKLHFAWSVGITLFVLGVVLILSGLAAAFGRTDRIKKISVRIAVGLSLPAMYLYIYHSTPQATLNILASASLFVLSVFLLGGSSAPAAKETETK